MSIFGDILARIKEHFRGHTPQDKSPGTTMTHAEVEQTLDHLADARKDEVLNWRSSVVDLLKLLRMDSSLPARKALAAEFHFDPPLDGSAMMNTKLHDAVMQKLEREGVPK